MQNQDEDFIGEKTMNEIIEADFFPPAAEAIQDASRVLIVDNDPDAAQSVEPSLNKPNGPSTFEVGGTEASSKRAES
jgi:hypothetical protein